MLWARMLAWLSSSRRPESVGDDAAHAALQAYGRLESGDPVGAEILLRPFGGQQSLNADVLFVQGLIHKAKRESVRAVNCFREAIRLREDFGAAWTQLGLVLRDANAMEEALRAFETAASIQSESPEIHQHLGITRYQSRDVPGAIAASHTALALQPDMSEARFVLAEALLAAGDFERGWAEYEHRPHLAAAMRRLRLPRWDAEHAIARLALVAEQGLGDVLMFARLVPRLRAYAKHIGVFVQAPLVELARESAVADDVRSLDELEVSQEYDAYVPFMSLPHVLALRPHELQENVPYIKVNESRISAWQGRVAASGGQLRVGLAWGGNATHARDSDRSIAGAALAPLAAVASVAFYSLQVGRPDLGRPPFTVTDFTPELQNLADTAALIDCLDLVISVDSAIAHLAGALGRPVWVLCPFRADWRWDIAGTESPWYASARVFRPERTAEWGPVIARVADALAGFARARVPAARRERDDQ